MKESADPAAQPAEEVHRVLVIGRDQLIRSGLRYDVDFIPTGRSFVPDAPLGYAPTLFTQIEYLWAYFRGEYRYALLSAPEPGSRRAKLLEPAWVRKVLRRFRPKGTTVALLDASVDGELPLHALEAFAPDSCWKRQLALKAAVPGEVSLHVLPCWAYPPALGWAREPWRAKEIDLFLPPGEDSPERREAAHWLERLRKERKLRVRVAPPELSDADLHELLGLSRVVLSPAGAAFHTPGHYQAMLHGAVPLINHPGDVQTTLVHGENALFYSPSEASFREIVLWTVEHGNELEILARQARQHALRYHTPAAVSQVLLEAAELPSEG